MEQYNIPEDFIRDPLDSEESSRIEYDEDTGYSLIIIDSQTVTIIPLPIIMPNGIVTKDRTLRLVELTIGKSIMH
jgi:magnesium transporter